MGSISDHASTVWSMPGVQVGYKGQHYTVNDVRVPSVSDIIVTPRDEPTTDEQRAAIQRAVSGRSKIPPVIQQITQLMTKIDNAQDIIASAYYLGRPLLKHVAPRMIPYLGWGLLALDAMDLINAILGALALPVAPGRYQPGKSRKKRAKRQPKNNIIDAARGMRDRMRHPERVVQDYMSKSGWRWHLGQLLQVAQASASLTGYGLQLGPLYGMAGELFWSGVQSVSNWAMPVSAPPPTPAGAKAANYLAHGPQLANYWPLATMDQREDIIAAHRLATSILMDSVPSVPAVMDPYPDIINLPPRIHMPWRPQTIAALDAELPGWRDYIDMSDLDSQPTIIIPPAPARYADADLQHVVDSWIAYQLVWDARQVSLGRAPGPPVWLDQEGIVIYYVTEYWEDYRRDHQLQFYPPDPRAGLYPAWSDYLLLVISAHVDNDPTYALPAPGSAGWSDLVAGWRDYVADNVDRILPVTLYPVSQPPATPAPGSPAYPRLSYADHLARAQVYYDAICDAMWADFDATHLASCNLVAVDMTDDIMSVMTDDSYDADLTLSVPAIVIAHCTQLQWPDLADLPAGWTYSAIMIAMMRQSLMGAGGMINQYHMDIVVQLIMSGRLVYRPSDYAGRDLALTLQQYNDMYLR